MKIQTITSIFAAIAIPFAIPFAMTSCGGDKEEGKAGTETDTQAPGGANAAEGSSEIDAATYSTHAEIIGELTSLMEEMMEDMVAIKDVPTAEAYADTLQGIKPRMKALHAAAVKLPAPTTEDIAAYEAATVAVQKKHGPGMMTMMMSMQNNPNAEEISEVMEGAMADDEMEQIGDEISAIYAPEESAIPEEAENKAKILAEAATQAGKENSAIDAPEESAAPEEAEEAEESE
ncbi:MAG: hypothetical protein R3242_05205 [Akkermansiaceae bacterium]|nr:hypothetical protein [Akkermansiaceae bacterium]